MLESADFFLLLFTLTILGIGTIMESVRGIGSGAIAWISLIASLKYGTQTDIRVAYMSIVLWMMASGFALWYRLFPDKTLNLASALLLSYLPPVGVFFIMSTNKLAQYVGLLYILLILVLPHKRISRNSSPNNWNKLFILAMGLQITIVAVITQSLYILPYTVVLWWWYKLEVENLMKPLDGDSNNVIEGG